MALRAAACAAQSRAGRWALPVTVGLVLAWLLPAVGLLLALGNVS